MEGENLGRQSGRKDGKQGVRETKCDKQDKYLEGKTKNRSMNACWVSKRKHTKEKNEKIRSQLPKCEVTTSKGDTSFVLDSWREHGS